jgi:uncharacterized protein YbcI
MEAQHHAGAKISEAAVRLLREYTGRGPTKARTTINHDTVMVIFGDTLTKAERALVANDKEDSVIQLRHDFQMVMRDDFVEIVEHELGRKVIAFMSANHIEPDMAVEIFVLQPER